MMKNLTKLSLLAVLLFVIGCYSDDELSYSPFYDMSTDMTGVTGDNYNQIIENPFINVTDEPTSTFSIDADGAAYANVRRFLQQDNQLPPAAAVRTEELINYFDYNYAFNTSQHPIDLNGEVSQCPWNTNNKLIRIGIKGEPMTQRPPSNFVFLVDVSGSMNSSDKLGLLQQGFSMLVDELGANDRVAIVTYSGDVDIALASTTCDNKSKIKRAINKLDADGSTAGGKAIEMAYDIAEQYFIQGGNNRIIVGTDGDFNVGITSQDDLVELIEEKRDLGVFLTILGVGRGNYNEGTLEQMANHGNGTFEYLDKIDQLTKVFIHDYGKFYTVAKDVKVQVQFDSTNVEAYRLIGYENRVLDNADFTNDSIDAGEIGAGQNITALYEIIPKQSITETTPIFSIDFRYKAPDATVSIPLNLPIYNSNNTFTQASEAMIFAGSVTAFGMLLIDSQYKQQLTYDDILQWMNGNIIYDPHGYKTEFWDLVNTAKNL
jgi:Ca-activated chloride channel family protein